MSALALKTQSADRFLCTRDLSGSQVGFHKTTSVKTHASLMLFILDDNTKFCVCNEFILIP